MQDPPLRKVRNNQTGEISEKPQDKVDYKKEKTLNYS